MSLFWQPGMTLKNVEKRVIEEAYRFYGKSRTATASALGIALRTLDYKLEEYAGGKDKAPTSNPDSGLAVEQGVETASQQTVSVRKRKKV